MMEASSQMEWQSCVGAKQCGSCASIVAHICSLVGIFWGLVQLNMVASLHKQDAYIFYRHHKSTKHSYM